MLLSLLNPHLDSWTLHQTRLQNIQPQHGALLSKEPSLSLTVALWEGNSPEEIFQECRAHAEPRHGNGTQVSQRLPSSSRTSTLHPFSWRMVLGWTALAWHLQGPLLGWYAGIYTASVTEGCTDAGWILVSDLEVGNEQVCWSQFLQRPKVRGNS